MLASPRWVKTVIQDHGPPELPVTGASLRLLPLLETLAEQSTEECSRWMHTVQSPSRLVNAIFATSTEFHANRAEDGDPCRFRVSHSLVPIQAKNRVGSKRIKPSAFVYFIETIATVLACLPAWHRWAAHYQATFLDLGRDEQAASSPTEISRLPASTVYRMRND
jgi:hypothetical protein